MPFHAAENATTLVTAIAVSLDRFTTNGQHAGTVDNLSMAPGKRGYTNLYKPMLDIFLASIALIVISPIIAIAALFIICQDGNDPFFRQRRVGANGRTFWINKLRTMHIGSEQFGVCTEPNDARITPVGRFLRRTKIDELPQLLNIIVGDMSVIGPRPLSLDEINHLLSMGQSPEQAGLIPTVKPGLIGLEQLNRGKHLTYADRFALNAKYENSQSWQTDLTIMLGSIWQCRHVSVLLAVSLGIELCFLSSGI